MRIYFNCGKAARGNNGIDPPRMGHCWWFWLPRPRINGGRLWRGEVFAFTINWLCFWVGFTLWPSKPANNWPTTLDIHRQTLLRLLSLYERILDAREDLIRRLREMQAAQDAEVGTAVLETLVEAYNAALMEARKLVDAYASEYDYYVFVDAECIKQRLWK